MSPAATGGAQAQARATEIVGLGPLLLDSRLPLVHAMARGTDRGGAGDGSGVASPGLEGLLALAIKAAEGRRAALHRA